VKCPKCSYLSFETGERCRNCGYEFSLSAPPADDPAGDLPLFDLGDDRPLVSVPAAPRQPLSVRRTTQDPARLKSRHAPSAPPREPDLDFDLDNVDRDLPPAPPFEEPEPPPPSSRHAIDPPVEVDDPRAPAPPGRRLAAGVIDAALTAGIDAGVIYLTLRLSGLDASQLSVLPIVPLAAFLMLLNGGYFVMFTAATGQTIGKMAAGIRVVGTSADDVINDRVSFGRAVLRTGGYLASLLPAGLGFVPVLIGASDRRALHDRLAETRVVRA